MTTLALPSAVKPRGTPVNAPQAFPAFHSPGPTSLAAVCVRLEPDVDGFVLLVETTNEIAVWQSPHVSGDDNVEADLRHERVFTFMLQENAYPLTPSLADNYEWRMAGSGEGKVSIQPYAYLTEDDPNGEVAQKESDA